MKDATVLMNEASVAMRRRANAYRHALFQRVCRTQKLGAPGRVSARDLRMQTVLIGGQLTIVIAI